MHKGITEQPLYFENDLYKAWAEDDIIVFEYRKGMIMGLDSAKEMVAMRKGVFYKQTLCLVLLTPLLGCYTIEAGKYVASQEGCAGLRKGAVVFNSSFNKVLFYNTFMLVCKPTIPARAFQSKSDAVEWLKK